MQLIVIDLNIYHEWYKAYHEQPLARRAVFLLQKSPHCTLYSAGF
ncbi:hypothetical protein [Pseudoalteromonas mariniglutinosa]